MSDQYTGGEQPQQDNGQIDDLLTLEDRVKREVAVIFGSHQLVTQEGGIDSIAVADLVYPVVSKAIAQTPGDRAKVGVTPTHLMEQFFPDVPGPADWASYDEDDAEFHEAVYSRVKSEVFRVLSTQPNGLVQMRLGANGGMVLCRTRATKGREVMAYVTRNRACINDDNNTPAMKAAKAAQAKADALAAMSIERVPEHAKWFAARLNTGRKELDDASKHTVKAALEMVTGDVEGDVDDE